MHSLPGPTVLLIELSVSGHRLNYLQWSARAIRSRDFRIVIGTVAETAEDRRFESGVADAAVECVEPSAIHQVKLLPRAMRNFLLVRSIYKLAAVKHGAISLVFLPYLDYVSYLIPVCGSPFGSIAFGGIFHRPYFHLRPPRRIVERVRLRLQRYLFERLLRKPSLAIAFTIDDLLYEIYGSGGERRLSYLPDPAFLGEGSGGAHLPCPSDRRLTILVYGTIDSRKGLAQLMGGLAQPGLTASYRIVSAGRHAAEVAEEIRSLRSTYGLKDDDLIIIDRYISDPDEAADLFAMADVVWIGYHDYYNLAGVLAEAGMAGKPVISADFGLNCHLVRKFELGIPVDIYDPNSVAAALKRLAEDRSLREEYGRNGRNKFSRHTVEDFVTQLANHEYFR